MIELKFDYYKYVDIENGIPVGHIYYPFVWKTYESCTQQENVSSFKSR